MKKKNAITFLKAIKKSSCGGGIVGTKCSSIFTSHEATKESQISAGKVNHGKCLYTYL